MAFPWLLGIGFNIVFGYDIFFASIISPANTCCSILTLKMCKLYSESKDKVFIKLDVPQKVVGMVCFVLLEVVS